jgi:hypothetical protein
MVFPVTVVAVIHMAAWACSDELFTTNSIPLDISVYTLKVFKYSETHWLGY